MSADRRYRLNRNQAEQLLRGESASGPASQLADNCALASLLAFAAAPQAGRELAGEAEAVTAFRRAHLGPAPQPRRPSMSATKLLVAKAVIAAVGVSGGGVALAAATGHLPANLAGKPAAASSAAAAASSAGGKSTSHPADPAASPSPSLRGLCQAYTARVSQSPGKALDSPAFTALITAAGGKDNVTAFCTSVLATHPGNAPASHPSGNPSSLGTPANTTHPTGKPTTVPTDHPTGKPTTVPTDHPTGEPTSNP
jgi:hypothetical protein